MNMSMNHMKTRAKHFGAVAVDGGWRRAAADRVVPAIAKRTHATPSQVKAVLGLLFVALSAKFLIGTIVRYRRT